MVSGSNEKELDIANQIADLLLEKEKLQQENKQLKEDLRVSQSNEETYCLEMQEITKILGLNEHTLFDDVKDYAKQLKEEIEDKIDLYEGDTISYQLGYDNAKALYEKILTELEEYLIKITKNGANIEKLTCSNILVYLKELKEKYK